MLTKKLPAKRRMYIFIMRSLMALAVIITAALVLFIIGYMSAKGLPHITWRFLTTGVSYLNNSIGILPNILNTLYVIFATLAIVLPLGVGAAVYLNEYAEDKLLVGIIEYAAETLSGIPSIIYGLVGIR